MRLDEGGARFGALHELRGKPGMFTGQVPKGAAMFVAECWNQLHRDAPWAARCEPYVGRSLPELTNFYEEHIAHRDQFKVWPSATRRRRSSAQSKRFTL